MIRLILGTVLNLNGYKAVQQLFMRFSSITTLIEEHLYTLFTNSPLKSVSLFLFVINKYPLTLEDSNKVQVVTSQDNLQAYLQSYDKIEEGIHILLQNVVVTIDFALGHSISKIDIFSQRLISDVGSQLQRQIKKIQLKLSVTKVNDELPLTLKSLNYLRRLQKLELVKKYYKVKKIDLTLFVRKKKCVSQPKMKNLDSDSVSLLRGLLSFVDKDELFRVLLRKPLKQRKSKKVVRMSVVPTDIKQDDQFQIKKKTFNRQTVLQLLAEYEAQQKQTK